jgi:hypothetical protein
MPEYVPRAHDTCLRKLVEPVRGSLLAVLVGDSSSGKTRALWEAARLLPSDWRIWRPMGLDPSRALLEALATDQMPTHTVLWLDDLRGFLSPASGEDGGKIAAGLRGLLADRSRAPVLIFGTLWREDWSTFTADRKGDQPDGLSRARELLSSAETIRVPEEFSAGDLDQLALVSAADPRLALAAAHADGRVTQFLAGIPELIRRFEMAEDPARALITAALDMHRAVGVTRLSEAFLRGAAPGYMDDHAWNLHGDEKFGEALAYVTQPSRGVPGPLEPLRPRPGDAVPAQPEYRLHDYLAERDRNDRRFIVPPRTFWDSAARHITNPATLLSLAEDARHRHYYRIADSLTRQAAALGDPAAMERLARELAVRGPADEALAWRLKAAEAAAADEPRNLWGAVRLAQDLQDSGREEEATAWWHRAVSMVDHRSMHDFGGALWQADRTAEAATWLTDMANTGEARAAGALVRLLENLGQYDDAIVWGRKAIEMGDSDARSSLLWLLEKTGQVDEAVRLREAAAAGGDTDEMTALAELLEGAGRTADAEHWLHEAARQGDYRAVSKLASQLRDAGQLDEAADLWASLLEKTPVQSRRHRRIVKERSALLEEAGKFAEASKAWLPDAEAGDTAAMLDVSRLLARAGELNRAAEWARRAAVGSGLDARIQLYQLLEQAGGLDEAINESQFAVRAGERHAAGHLAELLDRAGRSAEAGQWLEMGAENGDSKAMLGLATRLARDGDEAQADYWLKRAVDANDLEAMRLLTGKLEKEGRYEEAARIWLSAAPWGSYRELYSGIRLLRKAGKTEEAENRLRQAFEIHRRGSGSRLVAFLHEEGRADEARRLTEYGIEPGGATAEAWYAKPTPL